MIVVEHLLYTLNEQETALFEAIRADQLRVVEFLLNRGASLAVRKLVSQAMCAYRRYLTHSC